MADDAPDPRCGSCRNFAASDSGRWKLSSTTTAALVSIGVTVLMAAGGWVAFLATQAAHATAVDKSIEMLQRHDETHETMLNVIEGRLSHIEGMLDTLIDRAKKRD